MSPRLADQLVEMIIPGERAMFIKDDGTEVKGHGGVFTDYVLKTKKNPLLPGKISKNSGLALHQRTYQRYVIGSCVKLHIKNGETYENAAILAGKKYNLSASRVRAIYTDFKKHPNLKPIWNRDRTAPFDG